MSPIMKTEQGIRVLGVKQLLPIAIMAHNEEKVIRNAIENALSQITPIGYFVKVVVVANACTDRTEDIVDQLAGRYPDRVQLISITQKGKTRAINESIKLFERMTKNEINIPYVVFLDADCTFFGRKNLADIVNGFENNPRLCAISANCLPDVLFNERKDTAAKIYRATSILAKSVEVNSISGMCYGIRLDILRKIDFPEFQFAEDMYVSSRLNGWFIKDPDINIVFKTPNDMKSELNRRIRQEISSQRYREYYSYLKNKGIKVELFEGALGDEYRWGRIGGKRFLKAFLNVKSVKNKFYSIIYFLIILLAQSVAKKKMREIKTNEGLDYWKIDR